jgi:DNA-binding response OmpR family regulator
VIVMTTHGTGHSYVTRAFKRGATDFIQQPFDADEQPIDDKIREALEKTCEARHATCPNADGALLHAAEPGLTAPRPAAQATGTKRKPVIRLMGFLRNRRYLIEVNGKEVRLRGASLEVLCRMVGALLNEDQLERLIGSALTGSAYNAIHRLRKDLGDTVHDDVIVNDGYGKYRLSTHPENIEITESMRRDHPRLCGFMDGD